MSFRGEHPFPGMPPNKSIRGIVDSYSLKTHDLKFAHKITRILQRMQIISLKKPYAPKNTCTRHTLIPLPLLCRLPLSLIFNPDLEAEDARQTG